MMRRLLLLLALTGLCIPAAQAVRVQGLYEAEVRVTERSPEAQPAAFRQALLQVLVKLSGDQNIAADSAASGLLDKAGRYIQQFGYRQDEAAVAVDDTQGKGLRLWARFDQQALSRDMRAAGLPVWGSERPAVLVWLAVDDAAGKRLISADDTDWVAPLQQAAARRGIPLVFPLLDLQDTAQVSYADVHQGFREVLLRASQRYATEVVVSVDLRQALTDVWEGRWQLFSAQQERQWRVQGDQPQLLLEEGLDGAATLVAQQFASGSSFAGNSGMSLQVSGIHSLADYARVLRYLQSLDVVTRVDVRRVVPDEVSFTLIAHADTQSVQRTIALGRVLDETPGAGNMASYRLLPGGP